MVPPDGNVSGVDVPGSRVDAITATGNLGGGVNVAFADGSVDFIKGSVSLNTWWALGTRNPSEVVSSEAY